MFKNEEPVFYVNRQKSFILVMGVLLFFISFNDLTAFGEGLGRGLYTAINPPVERSTH